MSQGPDSFVSCRAEIQAQPGFLCPAQLLDTAGGAPWATATCGAACQGSQDGKEGWAGEEEAPSPAGAVHGSFGK